MKKSLLIFCIALFVSLFMIYNCAQITSAGSGNWSSSSTWVGSILPDSTTMLLLLPGTL